MTQSTLYYPYLLGIAGLFFVFVALCLNLVLRVALRIAGRGAGSLARHLWAGSLLCYGGFVSWTFFVDPLPSDRDMIEHFHSHRADYDELVRTLTEAKREGPRAVEFWLQSPGIMALKKRVRARDATATHPWTQSVIAKSRGQGDVYRIDIAYEEGSAFSWRDASFLRKRFAYFPRAPSTDYSPLDCTPESGRKCLDGSGIVLTESLDDLPSSPGDRRTCGTLARTLDENWFIFLSKPCI